jgi:hypothetical protein
VLTRLKTTHKAHPSPFGHWSASLEKKKKTPSINLKNPYMVGEKAQKERNPIHSLVRTPRHLISILN